MSSTQELDAQITATGLKIRQLKADKAEAELIKKAVADLLELKAAYKTSAGKDWAPAPSSAPPAPAPKKDKEAKKAGSDQQESKKSKKDKEEKKSKDAAPAAKPSYEAPKALTFYPSPNCTNDNMKCLLLAGALGIKLPIDSGLTPAVPRLPAISDKRGEVVRFGGNAVCRYLCEISKDPKSTTGSFTSSEIDTILDCEEAGQMNAQAASNLLSKNTNKRSVLVDCVLYPALAADISGSHDDIRRAVLDTVEAIPSTDAVKKTLSGGLESLDDFNPSTAGLLNSLRLYFSHAILKAFPRLLFVSDEDGGNKLRNADVARCNNPKFGDFQCNSAMGIAKAFKETPGYVGTCATSSRSKLLLQNMISNLLTMTFSFPLLRSTIPKDIGAAIEACLPSNILVEKCTTMPNGFINVHLRRSAIISSIASIASQGCKPPAMNKMKVIVDFSSPNIAKEMHVGHLRSTIIGDSICRILEFCGHDVERTNHVGDWGTQFGMLITHMKETYPDLLTNPPNITDLTAIYKASKKRFDDDPAFKERSRLAVVSLQSGETSARAIWKILCELSRVEFQKVYDMLNVELTEVGESFYNPLIPNAIELCQKAGIVMTEENMLLIKLAHFTIPLIIRKSDGGYGYDSTDLAAVHYRLVTKEADWVIYITDAGQAPHFYMIFDAAKAAGWVQPKQQLDHIGFGVVCGDDGKRFKTRSSETVRLIDLLDAAKDRMLGVDMQEMDRSAAKIGYGAVKYFDLKQNPQTNYIFSYDRMLDTKGDTAVYLMFAYARLASILKKASTEDAERALAFELMQFGDVIKSVLKELLPNRLCDYLQNLSVRFTDFVTKCRVLGGSDEAQRNSRLVLCESTRLVMAKCFDLLGIEPLERI
eukprot:GSChrysophyteH1.ASY1.ANO1.164.1 assembled CDS